MTSENSQQKPVSNAIARRRGFGDAFGVPAIALFSTMIGFGAISREAGLDAWVTFATTLTIWGMAGQIAYVELFSAGAGALVIFTAVALANLRMLPMTVSGMPLLHLQEHRVSFPRRLFYGHLLAVTGWAQLTAAQTRVPPHAVLPYYVAFVSVTYCSALAGTVFGYYLSDIVPDVVLRIAIYMTPLYIVLLVSSARQGANRLAVVLGAVLGPATWPWLGDWCILAAGFGGGTMALVVYPGLFGRKTGS